MSTSASRKWWVLGALSLGLFAVGLDTTILNVALPTLAAELSASTGQLQWMVDSYNLALAAVLLPAGMLGDRFGRKKLLLAALVLFGAASGACAYASTPEALIVMRVFLGIGSAFLIPLSMSVLPVLFEGAERTKAMMVWATVNMLGIPLGPLLGGWLLKHYAWGSVFLINVPLAAAAVIAVTFLMPESRSSVHRRFDLPGLALSSLGLTVMTYGVIRGGEHGWSDPAAWAALAGGAALLLVFVLWQRRISYSLIDLPLFRSASFTWGTVLATLVSFALFGLLFSIPQFLQAVIGADTLGTGLRLLPLILGLLVGAKAAQRLMPGAGAKAVAAAGFAVLAASLAAGAFTTPDTGYAFTAAWMTAAGAGLGLALPTSMDAALGQLTAERSGVGSALIMALRQVGGSFGVALLGAALNAGYRARLDTSGLPAPAAEAVRQSAAAGVRTAERLSSDTLLASVRGSFVHGMDVTLWIGAGIAALGMLLTLVFLPRAAAQPACPPPPKPVN
ncbi:DHA2 family efflux MFS transporter permease subunit [Paenibacillus aurantius]|uniref:DHA2 family efflux MFS transporter permease subunit n=1 Tax=Paenibacillus aurantius TaxID=2918900 RepID=A0AA96LDR8_9BACL|nr:DHA2 family efflux MFS transporter permease subunit [Paenibacillus aurantius]WNQ11163.1 DHA2 family efflux MFS transporter permease subunit [Paenibacillus aurantius]